MSNEITDPNLSNEITDPNLSNEITDPNVKAMYWANCLHFQGLLMIMTLSISPLHPVSHVYSSNRIGQAGCQVSALNRSKI